MSHDELRQQKALLLLDCQEARQELAGLKERARTIGQDIQQFGKWMTDYTSDRIYTRDQDQHGLSVNLLEDKYLDAMNLETALALADQIRRMTVKVKILEQKRRELGV